MLLIMPESSPLVEATGLGLRRARRGGEEVCIQRGAAAQREYDEAFGRALAEEAPTPRPSPASRSTGPREPPGVHPSPSRRFPGTPSRAGRGAPRAPSLAPGDEVHVDRAVWPTYPCEENGGTAWTARVLRVEEGGLGPSARAMWVVPTSASHRTARSPHLAKGGERLCAAHRRVRAPRGAPRLLRGGDGPGHAPSAASPATQTSLPERPRHAARPRRGRSRRRPLARPLPEAQSTAAATPTARARSAGEGNAQARERPSRCIIDYSSPATGSRVWVNDVKNAFLRAAVTACAANSTAPAAALLASPPPSPPPMPTDQAPFPGITSEWFPDRRRVYRQTMYNRVHEDREAARLLHWFPGVHRWRTCVLVTDDPADAPFVRP